MKAVILFGAGAAPGFTKGYVLYGKEGTLFLNLDEKKLLLGLKSEGGQLKEVNILEDKKERWKVCCSVTSLTGRNLHIAGDV